MNKPDRWCVRLSRTLSVRHRAISRWLALAIFCAASVQAVAQSSQCHLQLSEDVLDYGAVARAELAERQNSQGKAALAKRSLTLSVVCESATAMEVEFASGDGEQAGSQVSFTYRVLSAQLDGNTIQLVNSAAPEKAVSVLKPGDRMQPRTPSRGKRLVIQLEVEPELNATPTWATREGRWQGAARFQLYTH